MTLETQVAELVRAVNARNDDLKRYLDELELVKRENGALKKEILTTSFEVRLENTVTISPFGSPMTAFDEELRDDRIDEASQAGRMASLSEFRGVVGVLSDVVDLDLIMEVGEGTSAVSWGCLRLNVGGRYQNIIVDEKPQVKFSGGVIGGKMPSRLRYRVPRFSLGGEVSDLVIVNLGPAKIRVLGFAIYGRRG